MAAFLFVPNRALARGGGADFTRTKVFLVEKGKRRLLGHDAAMAAVQPGATVAVKPGKREKNGIIAVLIALLKSK